MKIKALIEKREALKAELKEMTELAVEEVRGLTQEEDEKYSSIEEEIRGLDKTISLAEEQDKKDVVKEETIKDVQEEKRADEERGIDMNKEQEVRGLDAFIRKEDNQELRGMTTTSQGGVIPTHLHTEIVEKLEEVAPLFSMIPKLTPVSGNLEILREKNIGTAGFVGESADLAEQDFTFDKVKLEQRRCGSVIQLTQKLINDSGIDIVGYSKENLFRRLGYALDRTMVNGQVASEQFEGLVTAKDKEECKVETGSSEAITIDDYMNTLNAMHPAYQGDAVWVMDREEFNKVALLKDAIGNYYLTRDVVNGKPQYRLFGCQIHINDAVQDVHAYLVNFKEAYAGMIKKDTELKHINADTKNALRGSATLVLDMYADARIKNENAIKVLVDSE